MGKDAEKKTKEAAHKEVSQKKAKKGKKKGDKKAPSASAIFMRDDDQAAAKGASPIVAHIFKSTNGKVVGAEAIRGPNVKNIVAAAISTPVKTKKAAAHASSASESAVEQIA